MDEQSGEPEEKEVMGEGIGKSEMEELVLKLWTPSSQSSLLLAAVAAAAARLLVITHVFCQILC